MQKWTGQMTPEVLQSATAIWTDALAQFDDETIKICTRECASNFDWPPSLAQFREQCASVQKREFSTFSNAPQYRPISPLLAWCLKKYDLKIGETLDEKK